MKPICQLFKHLTILGTLLILCTACPEYKSIKYPTHVYAGDTITIDIEVMMRESGFGNSRLSVVLPDGWSLLNDSVIVTGLDKPDKVFANHYGNNYFLSFNYNVDSLLINKLSTTITLVNDNDRIKSDTILIRMSDRNWFNSTKPVIIQTTIDKKSPLYLSHDNGILSWEYPKEKDGLKGVVLYNHGERIKNFRFTTSTELKDQGIARLTYKAIYEDSTEVFAPDTLVVNTSDKLYISNEGNDLGKGTTLDPLRSLKTALDLIEQDFLLENNKQVILRPGTYAWEGNTVDNYNLMIRDRISIVGESPLNTFISGNNFRGFRTHIIYNKVSFENFSIQGFNQAIDIPGAVESEVNIRNIHIQNADMGIISNVQRLTISNVLLDTREVGISYSAGFFDQKLQINNSTIVNCNWGLDFGPYIMGLYKAIEIKNTIFYDNTIDLNVSNPALFDSLKINHSIISDDLSEYGINNFYEDPKFIDNLDYPFLLSELSPAIDAGIDSAQYNDVENLNFPGLAEFPARGGLKNDLGIYGGGGQEKLVTGLSYREVIPYKVFPNPTTNYLEIEVENPYKLSKLQLVDMNGRIASKKTTQGRLDVRGVPPGIYLLRFNYENIQKTERVIIKGQ